MLMSSEIATYIETLLKKKDKDYSYKFWKLDDEDQIKTVTGICLSLSILLVVALISNFTVI